MPRKSGTGCITCRIRRVKCDETRPACQRCLKSRRRCDGYLPVDSTVTRRQLAAAARHFSLTGPITQAVSQCPGSRSRSASPITFIFFDVFRHSTAPSTASFLPSQFWTREVLQLAHSEPAVWHATVALGALHQRSQIEDGNTGAALDFAGLTRQAVEHHGRAISHAQQLKDPTKLLALSLALVSITNVLGRWSESQVHIIAAQRLLSQANDLSSKTAAEMLTRLDLQAMTFSDSSAPYPFREAIWLTQADKDVRQGRATESYGQAGTELLALFRRLILLDEALVVRNLNDEEYEHLTHDLALEITSWELRMSEFEKNGPSPSESWFYSVHLYHALLRLFIKASFLGPETRWDELLGYFERILACVEVLLPTLPGSNVRRPMSLEPGLIIPLFVVGQRCRHPDLRRRAIDYLRRLRAQEGMWTSEGAAAVTESITAMEEQAGPEYGYVHPARDYFRQPLTVQPIPWEAWSAGDPLMSAATTWDGYQPVPETRRVRDTLVLVDVDQRRIELSFIMSSGDAEGTYGRVRTDTAHF